MCICRTDGVNELSYAERSFWSSFSRIRIGDFTSGSTSGRRTSLIVGVYVLQVIISTLYLKKFKQGPMEALWRKWTYKNV
ncbi:DUF418 domain-containing protein [Lentibacillus sp. CBA3610]|nr:DUF418 domain-containing protein [Lentibacillus sp. CBA3610]